jgi:hypothetical protein
VTTERIAVEAWGWDDAIAGVFSIIQYFLDGDVARAAARGAT